ncbi:MAG TPA: D-aminoacylase [Gemmatimonadales bacterium]|jgi:N-acyl-D-amino-acid deacylase
MKSQLLRSAGRGIVAAGLLPLCLAAQTAPSPPAFLIHDAMIYDGTGSKPVRGSVRIRDGRIEDLGDLQSKNGELVVEAHGLTLAPGFIDTHSHADEGFSEVDAGVREHADALGSVSQGITTVVVGQDGGEVYPLGDFFTGLEKNPVAVNVASYAGHNTIRQIVMGEHFQREATAEEVGRMAYILRQEMASGALGLSTGLEYDPGIYSAPSEVLALARVAGAYHGRYISHIRSEDRYFWKALNEVITIGKETGMPVQVSHIKLAMRDLWGKADTLVRIMDEARAAGVNISADIYPYPYWHSTLTVLFPDRDYEDRKAAEFAVTQVSTPEGLLLDHYEPTPEFQGRTVADAAKQLKMDSVTALIELVRRIHELEKQHGSVNESVIGTSMTEPDIERLMRWPHTNFCTDGELEGGHPRGFGTYPRILGRYVRERKVMPLTEAIHKATALAAEHMGFTDRGRIATGLAADLVLFDPNAVIDNATTEKPHELSTGIVTVWVNGIPVFENGAATGARPGVVIRR